MNPVCSIFFHNYYGAHQSWMNYFTKNISCTANLYYNIVEDSMYNREPAEQDFYYQYKTGPGSNIEKLVVRQSSNAGKDIGGKMVLLDAYQKLGMPTGYGLFLHDKKSPYKANNTTWTDNLLKITAPAFTRQALQLLAEKPGIGIVTASGNVADEYDHHTNAFKSTNKTLLSNLQKQFSIQPSSFQYVTGTMFWFRMEPLRLFFENYAPLNIRTTLEKGNITDEAAGTFTHSWERMLCWIINAQNYTIKTI